MKIHEQYLSSSNSYQKGLVLKKKQNMHLSDF